jgi:hypothetical protein
MTPPFCFGNTLRFAYALLAVRLWGAELAVSNRAPEPGEWGYRPAARETVESNPPSLTPGYMTKEPRAMRSNGRGIRTSSSREWWKASPGILTLIANPWHPASTTGGTDS